MTLNELLTDYTPTYPGTSFLIKTFRKDIRLEYAVKKLERCSTQYDNCEGCSELRDCQKLYDSRCVNLKLG